MQNSKKRDVLQFVEVSDSPIEAMQELYKQGYTDGLPIVLPTQELVSAMYETHGYRGDEILGRMPPRWGEVSIDILAVNAVMAGCNPEYFPVIVAATKAMLDETFNLLSVQTTTHMVAPLLVISGPIRQTLGFCIENNAMGEGTHANATIGRAIRLILRNVGGAVVGVTDFVQNGSPARSGFVIAENEEQSPFPAFHVSLGFNPEESVVTVFATECPHNVNDHSSNTALSVLEMCGGTMATLGTNDLARCGTPILALGPELAAMLARENWTRKKIQQYVFDKVRVPIERMPKELHQWFLAREEINCDIWTDSGVPIADTPDDVYVLVVGGAGRHACYIPSFAFGKPVSQVINTIS